MATITAATPAVHKDTSAMASRMAGIAINPSISRMTGPSSQRT